MVHSFLSVSKKKKILLDQSSPFLLLLAWIFVVKEIVQGLIGCFLFFLFWVSHLLFVDLGQDST